MADQSIKNVTNIVTIQSGDKIPVGRTGNNQALVIQGSQLLKTASDLSEINTPTKKQNARDNLDVYSTTEVDLAITNEATARSNADNSLDARLDIVEGANTVVGSIAKAEKDAKDFSIQRVNHTGTQLSSTIIQSSVAINQEAIQPNDTQEVINNKINTQLIQRSAGLGSSITYYLTGQTSDVSGYEIASRDVDLTALQSESVVVNNNELIIDEYITSALNKSILNSGQWEANLYIGTSSTNGSSQIILRVYKRNISNTETLLFTAESSNLISTTPALVSITSYQSSFNIDATDRIVFKVYAKTTRNQDTTITLYHGTSDQFSHIHTPLLLNHNDLLGLNDGEFKHLSSTLYNRLSTITSDVQLQIDSKKNASDITNSWQGVSQTLFTSQKALYDGLNSINNYYAVYVDPSNGNDSTGNGTRSKPFATIQSAINSFTAGSPKVIYVNGSTTGNITFRSGDQSMMIVLDAKTQHSGTITFVAGNTSIYFLSQSGKATINGTINDASAGSIYFDAIVSGTYNKTGGSGSVSPTGYIEFSPNSCIDSLILNVSGNSTIRTLGTGAMGQLTQSNGIVALQHKGSVYCPVISGGANPSLGQPLCLLQGQLQLIKNGSNKSLTCNASYGIVYLAGISTFQNDFTTYGKIDFTGAGANCFCFVWTDCQLATSGDIFPPTGALLPNFADYLSANRTPTNYTVSSGSVKAHLQGIDTKLGTVQTALGYTAENQANKENTTLDTSTTKYPTNNLVKTSIDAKVEDQITDGVTTKAPSQNAVFDALALKLNTSLKGANNGLAELGSDGKIPSSQLPAYVDDVLEYTDFASFPATGETGKIYIALDTNITYRWSGSVYVVIGSSLALGETSSTAYRGDRGKISYDHSQLTTGNPHNVTKSDVGLGNVDNTTDLNKPVSTATQEALNLKQDSSKQTILQINHGFTVGKVVRQNTNGTFSLAQANNESNSRGCGIIVEVLDSNTFSIFTNGSVPMLTYSDFTNAIASQLGYANWLLVPTGKTYYLSPTTAGNITETKPTTAGQYVIPVFRKVFGESDNIDLLLPTIDDAIGTSGGGSWGSITGTIADQTDLQNALDDKLNNPYSIVDITSVILGSAPSSYGGLLAFATDTGVIYKSNGSAWNNVNGGGSSIKNDFNLGHIPTTTDNASQGFSVGSQASVNAEGDIYTLVSFSGTDANWITNASVNFVDDKATFEGINWLNLPTGEITYANQVFQIANANGMVSTGSNTGGGTVFSNGETAIYTVNSSGTGYSFTSKVSSGGSSSITVDGIITQAQNKSSLPAGNYITTVAFSDGMPAGISINDIFNKSSTNVYTLVSSYANYKVGSIKVGSGTSAKLWIQNAGSWTPSANPKVVTATSTEAITSGNLVVLSESSGILRASKAVTTVAGASSSIQTQTSASNAITLTATPQYGQVYKIDTDKVVAITTDSVGNVRLRIGIVSEASISWGSEVISTTIQPSFNMILSVCPVVAGSYFYFATRHAVGSTLCQHHLVQFSGNSIIAQKYIGEVGTSGAYGISTGDSCSFVQTSTGRYTIVTTIATYAQYTGIWNIVIEITSLNGVNSTFNFDATVNAVSVLNWSVDVTAIRGCIKVIPSSLTANSVIVLFGRYNGYIDASRFSISGKTATPSIGFVNITSTGSNIIPLGIQPTSVNGKYITLHFSDSGTTLTGGFISYLYVNMLVETSTTLAFNTTFASTPVARPLQTPVSMMFKPFFSSLASPSSDVYQVCFASGTNSGFTSGGNATWTVGVTSIYQNTFSCNATTNAFSGWVDQGGGNLYSLVTSSARNPSTYAWAQTNNTLASGGNGRTVMAWSDNASSGSIVTKNFQFGNAVAVNMTGYAGMAQNTATSANQQVAVALRGSIANVNQTLTVGQDYFVQPNGTITTTYSSYRIGRGININNTPITNQLELYPTCGDTAIIDNRVTQSKIESGLGDSVTFIDPITGINDGIGRIVRNGVIVARLGIGSNSKDIELSQNLFLRHLIGYGSSPTISAGVGAGSSPTISINGNDIAGSISLTTGSSPVGSNSIIATITFNLAYTTAPFVILTAGNRNANLLNGVNQVLVPVSGQTNGITTTTFVIESGSTALSGATTYIWKYQIIQ